MRAFARNAPYAPTPDNRPVPLKDGPLPLTRDADWQMSFGERAALEGVLAQLRPSLALEIGSASGGSLVRIAEYSQEVHTIDLTHEEIHREELPSHVHLQTGDSAELLGPLLESLSAAGRALDFALVDGDHSFEGVRRDVQSLLDSPTTDRSVILVHDTMNPEVRAGVECIELARYPKLIYVELEFVPGYVYARGACRGAAWGGIGLLITDSSARHVYPAGPHQTRYVELFDAVQRMRGELSERPPEATTERDCRPSPRG